MKKEIEMVNHPEKLDGLRVVQNIDEVVKSISDGETIARFEFGNSMRPVLCSGQYARLVPLHGSDDVQIGDAVFCNVGGYWMTHMVWNKNRHSKQYLIGSSSGEMYGWTDIVLATAIPMPYIEKETED